MEEEKQPLTHTELPAYEPPPQYPHPHAAHNPYNPSPPSPYQPSPPSPYQPSPTTATPVTSTHTTATVIRLPAYVRLGATPVTAVCSTGNHQVTTHVEYTNGNITWLAAVLLCFFLGPLCAIIPFFMNDLKDVVHTCPVHGTVIGVYHRM